MSEVDDETQGVVRVISTSNDEIALTVPMTFPRKGMANQLDSWRNWLDQGKSAGGHPLYGVRVPVNAVMRALAEAEAVVEAPS